MNAQSSLLLKVQCIRLLTKECLQSSAEADSIINYAHVIPTDKSVGYYHSSAAPTFEPKPFVIHKHYVPTALFCRQTPPRASGMIYRSWILGLTPKALLSDFISGLGFGQLCEDW